MSKDSLRLDAYGTVDELNAAVGLARASLADPRADASLAAVQDDLFAVGAALADPDPSGPFHDAVKVERAARLEREIDAMEAELAPLTCFILPGGTIAAAHVHLARTICRRAERLVVALAKATGEAVTPDLLIYLNRLSDHLFVLARTVNSRAGTKDVPWNGLK